MDWSTINWKGCKEGLVNLNRGNRLKKKKINRVLETCGTITKDLTCHWRPGKRLRLQMYLKKYSLKMF